MIIDIAYAAAVFESQIVINFSNVSLIHTASVKWLKFNTVERRKYQLCILTLSHVKELFHPEV